MLLKFKKYLSEILLNKKTELLLSSLFFPLIVAIVCTSSCFFAHLPINKPLSLAETSEIYKTQLEEEPATIIYGKEIFNRSYELLSVEPEKSKEIRSIFPMQQCFDGYLANWENKYSPIKTSIDGKTKNYSLLLWPKNGYKDSRFLYEMPLIAGKVDNFSNSLDIYITKSYADYLIGSKSLNLDYEEFLTENPNISFFYEDEQNNSSNFCINYNLKGIIDDTSEIYLKYYNYFGDYFIANQYLFLPIPHFTYFETTQGLYAKKDQIKILLNVYDYTANRLYNSALLTSFAYEYRIAFIGKINSPIDFWHIWDNENSLAERVNLIFDEFTNGDYLLTAIVSVLFTLAEISCILCFAWRLRIRNKDYFLSRKNTIYRCLVFVLFFSFSLVVGFLLTKSIKFLIPSMIFLSPHSPYSLIVCTATILLTTLLLFCKKPIKN